jgi:hypothetical protein
MTKLEFGHANGDHGLHFEGTVVKRVDSQAKKIGVKPGWKIYVVDGHVCNSDEDIFLRLQEAKWQWRSCFVYFCTDMAMIRAEQARTRAAMIQAEMERVAKLPFEGANDNRHLAQLKEEFSFKGSIDKVEERAITPAQLQKVIAFAKGHCHRWRDCAPKDVSRTAGQKLHIDFMNLYHVNYWVIKPSTQEKNCSFVEMLTSEKQKAKFFAIHYWGERILDFSKCIEFHAKTRSLGQDSGYWVSAYANRQHGPLNEGTDFPKKMGFYKAMVASNFHVVITLDPKAPYQGPCSAFQRIWCDLEISMCVEPPNAVVDVICLQASGRTAMVTRGLTDEEDTMEYNNPGTGWKAKSDREKSFNPETLMQYGMGIQIDTAEAMEPKDENKILNHIAGRELHLPVAEKHESYTKFNKRLHALFALVTWRRVFAGADADTHTQQLRLMDALKVDPGRKSLSLSLAFANNFEEKLVIVMKNLSPGLKELNLNLQGTNITDERLVSTAALLPPALESIKLDLSNNPTITDVGVANFTEKLHARIKEQQLLLKATSVSKELASHADDLDSIRQYIKEEAEKGAMCTTINLLPSANRRMVMNVERSKC